MKQHVNQALKLRKWVSIGHHIPGRIRLKYKLGILAHLASYKSDAIEEAISSVPAFKSYQVNKATGSILIEYDASLVEPALITELFAESEVNAEQACYAIAEKLNLNGE
ncbi:HMA2 domain-containing protein [Vibrio tubiashii]|uniref:Cation transporter n=1 Tax=Vibrio tubiashii TaxID=29498 RepID=A0AAE5GPX0_9VIBR|nr:cation transporter [Vibrio tubiashii]MCG9582350.1 cation transporter [Vibrio tubiashii]MCG9615941.1 cation transporter [Vibrio tubiashii]MCG9689024.1 cation transporter [Vibrio tubiashii]NOI80837.1 cation transporter [Vibrio tubiashii]